MYRDLFDLLGRTIKQDRDRRPVPHNLAHVAVVEGVGFLPARNLVGFGVAPAAGRRGRDDGCLESVGGCRSRHGGLGDRLGWRVYLSD